MEGMGSRKEEFQDLQEGGFFSWAGVEISQRAGTIGSPVVWWSVHARKIALSECATAPPSNRCTVLLMTCTHKTSTSHFVPIQVHPTSTSLHSLHFSNLFNHYSSRTADNPLNQTFHQDGERYPRHLDLFISASLPPQFALVDGRLPPSTMVRSGCLQGCRSRGRRAERGEKKPGGN